MNIADFLSLLRGVKSCGDGWKALCPAHDDQKQSLHVSEGKDGRILAYCHAGCSVDDICQALGLGLRDLFSQKLKVHAGGKSPVVATYDYRDTNGKLLFQVCRTADKRFFQRRPDGKGGWINGLGGIQPVLYRLPEVLQAVKQGETIFIPEGEKDVNNLARLGLAATCNPLGACKWRDHYSEHLMGAAVAVLPDLDKPGRKHAQQVAKSLYGRAASVKILELPGLPRKGDVSDWLAAGGTKEELLQLVAECPEWEPTKRDEGSRKSANSIGTIENLTDLGNGRRFVAQAGGNFRYLVEQGKWLHWTGKRWEVDKNGAAMQLAKKTALSIYREVELAADPEMREAIVKHAVRSESEPRLKAMMALAQSEPGIPVSVDDLDKDPWLLNCRNGVLDLRTGRLREHLRSDLITRMVPVKYDPAAECPEWLKFLDLIMTGDDELISYLQRVVGYCLSGITSEKCFFILYGGGNNGKTTFLENIYFLMGDLAANTPISTLVYRKYNDSIPNDIAALRGKRLVFSSEIGQNHQLHEEKVKALTGGTVFKARFLHREWFEFKPEFKIFLDTNYKPRITGTDNAIWNRVHLIPFTFTFPEESILPRDKVDDIFKKERAGILAWAVRGCLEWQRRGGLEPPAKVRAAGKEYRTESDPLAEFLEECCEISPTGTAASSDLFRIYKLWAECRAMRFPLGSRTFSEELSRRGFDKFREPTGQRRWMFIGIRIYENVEENLRETVRNLKEALNPKSPVG